MVKGLTKNKGLTKSESIIKGRIKKILTETEAEDLIRGLNKSKHLS